MGFEELLKDPEGCRHSKNFRATNIVFPVEYEGKIYVVKKPRLISSLIESYYVFQDKFFHASIRRLSSVKERYRREVDMLDMLNGLHAPRLIAHNSRTIVREYLDGEDFRSLESKAERIKALEGAIYAIGDFHQRGVALGNAHVKNIIKCDDGIYWCDFEGKFDESDIYQAQALDLLKFIYSTYTVTRESRLMKLAALLVCANSKMWHPKTMEAVLELSKKKMSSLRLWFPTRLPIRQGEGQFLHTLTGDILGRGPRLCDDSEICCLKERILTK